MHGRLAGSSDFLAAYDSKFHYRKEKLSKAIDFPSRVVHEEAEAREIGEGYIVCVATPDSPVKALRWTWTSLCRILRTT